MKNIYYGVAVLLTALLFFSCQKNQIDPTFKGETQLIIGGDYWVNNSARDSVIFSFAEYESEVTEGEVLMNVSITGNVSNMDRQFSLAADPVGTTALTGEYELPSLLLVPAGQVKASFIVKVKRTPRLTTELAKLVLKIVPNEHFKPGVVTPVNTVVAANLSPIVINYGPSFKILWTDVYTKPPTWDVAGLGIRSYVGDWSPAKHKFIVDVTGKRSFVSLPAPEKYALTALVYKALDEYNIAHPNNPLLNEAGQTIQICSNCP